MKIKRLEIHGFKSFPDKTVIEFPEGITGVVGPNGCGKSNIVDAMRWVMGEMSAKHLRGKAMEDVIFSGSDNRPPIGMAEVTMILSNEDGRAPATYADFTEISVTRRLYRSGESEYALNKVNCRLKDIYDLFLGSGVGTKAYSIIEQGKIGQVVGAKPEERRMIIEEAAGISKFKSRKEAATRKMEATRANLLRLADVLAELKRQINSLDRQAKKAERYRELETELKEIELHLSSLEYLKCSGDLQVLEKALQELEIRETALAAQVGEHETQVESDRLTLLEKEREYLTYQEELYEKNNSVQLHQAGIDFKTREIESLAKQNEAAAKEIEVAKDRLSALDQATAQANEEQFQIDLKVASTQESHSQLENGLENGLKDEKAATLELDALGEMQIALLQEVSELQSRKESLGRRKVDLAGRIGKDQGEIDEIDRQIGQLQTQRNQLQGQLGEVKQYKLDLVRQADTILQTIGAQREELKATEAQHASLVEQVGLKRSRLTSLEELEKNFEGYKEGVRNVMLKRGQIDASNRIYGTVADILETDSGYETAVGAVLGEKLQYVVVKSQEVGLEALQYLKTQSSGRLSCIPVELRKESEEDAFPYASEPGVIGPLKNFIRVRDDYDRIGNYLFGDVVLVENLRRALDLWQGNGHQKTLVTLDGEVVDPSGVVSGGTNENGAQVILEKKREIKDLRDQVRQCEAKLREKADQVEHLRSRIGMLEHSLENLKRDSHSEELKIVHQEQDLSHLQSEMRRFTERRDRLSLEISSAMQEESETVGEIELSQQALLDQEQRQTRNQEQIEQVKLNLAVIRNRLEELRGQLLETKSLLATVNEKKSNLEKDLQRKLEERSEQAGRLEERRQAIGLANHQITGLKGEIEESRQRVTELVIAIQEREAGVAQLKQQVGELKNAVQNCELELRQKRQGLEGLRQELNQRILGLSEGRTRVQVLREQILERYHVDLGEIAKEYTDRPIDVETERPRAAELRERLEKIGAVNLGAIEEYSELQKRHEFLDTQYKDLEAGLEALSRALQKINRTTKKRFEETFHKVNELFQEVFPKLFKGGKAELVLTNPENMLESGVDIIAQPPGKKLQSVSLLSGGEKALTAVSLVFAIFIIKPSPFCLLDEVDAPLDDANIDRFNDMVRSMVDRSQFILITHNKRTMEMADTLYGITMEQAGVSKLVSVKLQ